MRTLFLSFFLSPSTSCEGPTPSSLRRQLLSGVLRQFSPPKTGRKKIGRQGAVERDRRASVLRLSFFHRQARQWYVGKVSGWRPHPAEAPDVPSENCIRILVGDLSSHPLPVENVCSLKYPGL